MNASRALAGAALLALAACSDLPRSAAPAPPPPVRELASVAPTPAPQPPTTEMPPATREAPPATSPKPQTSSPRRQTQPGAEEPPAKVASAKPAPKTRPPAPKVEPKSPRKPEAPPAAKTEAKPAAKPAPTPSAIASAKAPAAPPLDLDSLERRLKESDAIGVMTKLSLRNQVDDLLDRFRDYYAGRTNTTLAELRRPFDLLLMKVLALLQDRDPALAQAIHDSRDALWAILADRSRFEKLT